MCMDKTKYEERFAQLEGKVEEISKKIDVLEQKILSIEDVMQQKINEIQNVINVIDEDYYPLRKEVVKKIDVFNEDIGKALDNIKEHLISLSKVAIKNRKYIDEFIKKGIIEEIKDKER